MSPFFNLNSFQILKKPVLSNGLSCFKNVLVFWLAKTLRRKEVTAPLFTLFRSASSIEFTLARVRDGSGNPFLF